MGDEKSAPEKKMSKERVTLLTCANAIGTEKLSLLMIGKSKNPQCFKQRRSDLQIIYKNQKSAWTDRYIFMEWFRDYFVPFAKEKRVKSTDKFNN